MTGFFRSLFGSKKSISKIKPRMQTRRLELIGLEERITPVAQTLVDFTTNTGVLSLTSDAASFSVVANANGTLTVNSASAVSAGSSTTVTVLSIGNNNYTVSVNSGPGNVKELSLIGDSNNNNITVSGIDSSAFNADFGLNVDTSTGTDILSINGLVALKGTGALTTAGIEILNIAATGDITAASGAVSLSASSLMNTAGDITTTSGAINYNRDVQLTGNVAIKSTSGNLTMRSVGSNASSLSINEGTGTVTIGNLNIGTGNLTISSTATPSSGSAISLANVAAGDISLTAAGDITAVNTITAASVNAKSTAGDVIFADTVTTTQVGGFTSEASDATKATKIANAVTVGAGANALVTGNLISNSANSSSIATLGLGNITITGNVDASVAGNCLYLDTGKGTGIITISGNVGSSATAFGELVAYGKGSFQASGTIKADQVFLRNFTTSITFAKAVTTTGSNTGAGVNVTAVGAAPITFSDSITNLGDPTSSKAQIRLSAEGGAINVAGAITGLDFVEIYTVSGAITLSGSVTTSGTKHGTSGYVGGDISIATSTSGNILLSGNISTTGTGDIFLGADALGVPSPGTGNLTINGTVSSNAGAILIGAGGASTVSVNKALTTTGTVNGNVVIYATGTQTNAINFSKDATITSASEVIFKILNPVNTVNFASGANISAVGGITDGGAGGGNLNLANNLTTTNGDINIPFNFINLTGSVSMKAAGSGKDIFIGNINGAQNLTLEATDQINFTTGSFITGVGQTTPLNTITIINSARVLVSSPFSAANVVLSDTTGIITFNGPTSITNSLTTAAKPYSVEFYNTTVLSGAPVFLNTGNVSFSGITSLPSGATITGGPATVVDLSGTIVSGGAFNIGAGSLKTNIANFTTLNLTSTTNESTIANRVVLANTDEFYLNGVGTLTLSGDSSDPMHMNGFVGLANVTNGTINVTGKLCVYSAISLTNAAITGNGELGGVYSSATSTTAPSGTLTMNSFYQDPTSTYKVSIFSPVASSKLSQINSTPFINNSTLALSEVVSGLIAGDQFTIIDAGGSSRVTGSFRGLPEGATISALDTLGNTVTFAISYVGGTGNDVTLRVTNVSIANPSAIPQPMVAGQPVFNFFTAVGADAGGGPMVTVTIDILPGLTTVPTYFSFFAYDAGFTGGVRVAINELDGDNTTTEIITGAGPGGGPNVKVFQFNFATLTFNPNPIASFFAFNDPNFQGGVYVAGGDVTGDGIGDLLVGAGAGGGPRVQVYAGSLNGVVTSSPISDFFAYSTAFTGGVVVAAGDRLGDNTFEVITGPASNGGYNIKSFNVAGAGNNPTLVENFFAFNDFTSIGGLSIATTVFDVNPIDDLVIGTTNTQFGVILNQNYAGIKANPFPGFTGAIRAGFADNLQTGYQALAAAGPGGGPVVTTFSVGATSLTQTDSLFVLDPAFTGGLFAAN